MSYKDKLDKKQFMEALLKPSEVVFYGLPPWCSNCNQFHTVGEHTGYIPMLVELYEDEYIEKRERLRRKTIP